LIGEHLNSLGAQRMRNPPRIGGGIVISQHRPQAMRSLHLTQQAGARFGIGRTLLITSGQGHRDEVADERDQVRMQTVDHPDCGLQRMRGEVRVVVKIRKESDRETVKPLRPAGKRDWHANDARVIGLDQDGVGRDGSDARARRESDESTPGGTKKWQSFRVLTGGICGARPQFRITDACDFAICRPSETEGGLQINAAVGHALRERTAHQ
jgi:hypothetical protein